MNVHLLYEDRDFDAGIYDERKLTEHQKELINDLGLQSIIELMSGEDEVIREVVRANLLKAGTREPGELFDMVQAVRYRQEIMSDVLANRELIRDIYQMTIEVERKRKESRAVFPSVYLTSTYSSAMQLIAIYLDELAKMRKMAGKHLNTFHSKGLTTLIKDLSEEVSDEYIGKVKEMFKDLKDTETIYISADFGVDLTGVNYAMCKGAPKLSFMQKLQTYSFNIAENDETSMHDLERRRDRAINEVTNALACATDNLQGFFKRLRLELAFYVGNLNLTDALRQTGLNSGIPELSEGHSRAWSNLADLTLVAEAIQKKKDGGAAMTIIGNTGVALKGDKLLYVITGANQGGKTAFLRSLGQAQLMENCGMLTAGGFTAPIKTGVFTHFRKEEDRSMTSGKLDEELVRMDGIIREIKPGDMLLMNESFQSTNEREGSEICHQVTKALIDNDIEVMIVTHLYAYAISFRELEDEKEKVKYLRAERTGEGVRTFRMVEGEPLATVFGGDIYKKIFEKE